MVSALWKACSAGDLENVVELLKESSSIDIEIKDHTGVTPLIEAVKNGHVEIVRVLLEKGADPINGSSQARPEQYTSDPVILDLLNFALSRMTISMPSQESVYPPETNGDSEKRYYAPSPGPYAYYPAIHPGAPPIPEGAMPYYPVPPPQLSGEHLTQGGPPNLPPPEIARFIPCRYFPACRYGSSCLFAHPQGPYFQGPLPPPAQYSVPYDPMTPQPYAPYYAVPPSALQHPNGTHVMTPISSQSAPHHLHTHAAGVHHRPGSEVVSSQGPYSVSPGPPPIPYGVVSPVSPSYPRPAHASVPLSAPPPPPLQHQPPPPGPQSPQPIYIQPPPSSPPFAARQDTSVHPPSQAMNGVYPDTNGGPDSQPLQAQTDSFHPAPSPREGFGNNRRGAIRRGSFGRKPACLFYPAGRCKNGDDCRFPHIQSEGTAAHQPQFVGRGGFRNRSQVNGNGFKTIEEKLAGLTIREDQSRPQNGAEGSSRSQSTDAGSHQRHSQGFKNYHTNGARVDKKSAAKQRVPNADEFPVLMGATTPPSRSPGLNGSVLISNGHYGPTAAQVLQAPPPARKDSKESSPRATTPEPRPPPPVKPAANGVASKINHEHVPSTVPISYSAEVNTAGNEVSVSA